jgi:hypothetical protein
MAERGLPVAVQAAVVGSAMRDDVAHAHDAVRAVDVESIDGDEADDAAHN